MKYRICSRRTGTAHVYRGLKTFTLEEVQQVVRDLNAANDGFEYWYE